MSRHRVAGYVVTAAAAAAALAAAILLPTLSESIVSSETMSETTTTSVTVSAEPTPEPEHEHEHDRAVVVNALKDVILVQVTPDDACTALMFFGGREGVAAYYESAGGDVVSEVDDEPTAEQIEVLAGHGLEQADLAFMADDDGMTREGALIAADAMLAACGEAASDGR